MRTVKSILLTRIHQVTVLACTALIALFIAGCASTGGSSGRSVTELKAAADKGDALAQYELGDAYFYGKGVTKDYKTAEMWYKKSQATYQSKAK